MSLNDAIIEAQTSSLLVTELVTDIETCWGASEDFEIVQLKLLHLSSSLTTTICHHYSSTVITVSYTVIYCHSY